MTKTYTYDNAGNLTTVTSGISTLKTYTYDAWGRQTGYSEPLNLVTATYTYGPDNLRRCKTVGANTTSYVWSGSNMVYESTGSSGTVYRYGATLFASDDGTATYTYLLNGHGDVVQLLAGTTVVKSYNYDAFGNEIGINTADTNPFRYCAQYYDKESGTIYLRARYYAPGQGRFTQQDDWTFADPNNSSSLNLYVYCWNDPILYIDANGQSPQDIVLGLVLALDGSACGGFGQWVIDKFKGKHVNYQFESEYDYYLGRLIGDVLSMFIGAGMSVKGIIDIISSITNGAAITIGSGGIAIAGGATISIAGTATGAVEITLGATVMYASYDSLKGDWDKLQRAKRSWLSRQELNRLYEQILSGEEIVYVDTKEQAEYLIQQKFSSLPQESAGNRSANGWHYDEHEIVKGGKVIKHINIYSKDMNFRSHIIWGNQ